MSPRNLSLAALLAATVFIAMPKAHAGYAQVSPPAGWSAGTGATYGSIPARFGSAAANSGSMWSASTTMNVGGRAVTIPATGRFAANAGRFAARGFALNPAALGVAAAAWFAEECIKRGSSGWEVSCGGATPVVSDGFEYQFSSDPADAPWTDLSAACSRGATAMTTPGWGHIYTLVSTSGAGQTARCLYKHSFKYQDGTLEDRGSSTSSLRYQSQDACPAGWYRTSAGCVATPQPRTLTPKEVEEIMAPKTVPPQVYPEVPPDTTLPIGPPSINPGPSPDYSPQPLHVPTGDPVLVPNSNPQRWEQPIVTITPAPTPESPWQVSLTPEKVVSNSPTPIRDPWTGPLPAPSPGGEPAPDRSIESDPTREPEVAPADTELPELPKLYEPKYKNGLEGVWNEQKDKIKSAPLSNLIENLMPKVNDGGSCPTWNVQLDFSTWANYGSKNVAPPCEVWDWGRMIILVSALILARALIFGG